ncbi:MAG TPA: hypothetical protein VFQ41_19135 [Candidatus Angelobacter sp.]|nr:hypothetical protein [Candidatus Angelobacter sp.]
MFQTGFQKCHLRENVNLREELFFLAQVPPCLRGEDSDSLPDRAAVPAGTVGPVGFPAESRKSDGAGARPCDLAHSVPPTSPGTTTMPAAKMSGSQAAGNARLAAVQFGCDPRGANGLVAVPQESLLAPMNLP